MSELNIRIGYGLGLLIEQLLVNGEQTLGVPVLLQAKSEIVEEGLHEFRGRRLGFGFFGIHLVAEQKTHAGKSTDSRNGVLLRTFEIQPVTIWYGRPLDCHPDRTFMEPEPAGWGKISDGHLVPGFTESDAPVVQGR